MRTSTLAATLVLVTVALAAAGTVAGQTNELGIGGNDVREEPSHPDDLNNFQDGDPFWSPQDDPLVLDAYAFDTATGLDLDNIVNRVLHGENYDEHERTMYPGSTHFEAWWGWWSDTGGGGSLQGEDAASGLPSVGEPNGAIDDADDCENVDWDEFTWRGDHDCPDAAGYPAYRNDTMYGFVQPGSTWSFNQLVLTEGPVETLTETKADGPHQPDFVYQQPSSGQAWYVESNRGRVMTDSSLLISTSVTTAVNPEEIGESQGITTYDPFQPANESLEHAVDVDVYTTPHPAVEQAYRTTVWDPDSGPHPDRGESLGVLHDDGPKGWLKDDGGAFITGTQAAVEENASDVVDNVEPQLGFANDLVQDPFFHEPNHPDDDYNGWATYDADTSYGGLDGDYYEPGPDQSYPGYQAGERFWFDAQVALNSLPFWIPFYSIGWDSGTQTTPEVPSTSNPVEDAASEDSTSQGPGILLVHAHAGTWYDGGPQGDQDTWVGDAPPDPYNNGTDQDPNQYEEQESPTIPAGASGPEFRGTCGVDVEATLYPTSDTDGDGTNDWGEAGVYVMGYWGDANPYSNVWMDVVGPAADPVLDPLRQDEVAGGEASYMFPEDQERLSRHRTEGPIEVRDWDCAGMSSDVGFQVAQYNIILPTGTLDFTFKSIANGTLTDGQRQSQHGNNEEQGLDGQSITDVDRYGRMLEDGP